MHKHTIPPYQNQSIEDLPDEIWRFIPGFEDHYLISTMGRVKSLPNAKRKTIRILKPKIGKRGYHRICLSRDKVSSTWLVHRLALQTFKPSDNPKLQCNHRDGDKNNNCLYNLEWVTPSRNIRHSYDSLKRPHTKAKTYGPKLTEADVLEIRNLYATGEWTLVALGRKYNVHESSISLIVKHRTWKHVGGPKTLWMGYSNMHEEAKQAA